MVSELHRPTVVVLHGGNVDPAPLAIKSGISIPSLVLGFTDFGKTTNPYNSNIGDVASSADQLLIEDSVYDNYSPDCSEAVLGIRSSKRPCEVNIFNVSSGVFHLLFAVTSERSSLGLRHHSAELPSGFEVTWPDDEAQENDRPRSARSERFMREIELRAGIHPLLPGDKPQGWWPE